MRRPAIPYFEPAKVDTLEIDVSPDELPALDFRPEKATALATAPVKVRKVLLLEDRDDFREVLSDHLVFRGFQVTSVPSGVEGLGEITKSEFDVIICDMMMPRGGGEMFYWAVTRMRPAAAQRFIFFTGHRNNPSIEFFFKRVNASVLLKPFQLSALDSMIDEVFRRAV